MDENGKSNKRFNQVEEQLAITLKSVDKLTEDMQKFKEYAYQSNQTFNRILHKLDDHQEEIEHLHKSQESILSELAEDRRLRTEELKRIDQRLTKLES